MKRETLISILLIVTTLLTSCAPVADVLKPRPFRTSIFTNTPSGNSSYDQGFQDGCSTFAGIIGGGTYRLNGHKYDPDRMVQDQWYLRGFQDASHYCTLILDWETH